MRQTGKPEAITATAHKLARIIYAMLKNKPNTVTRQNMKSRCANVHSELTAQGGKAGL
jgi:hypothetical protein